MSSHRVHDEIVQEVVHQVVSQLGLPPNDTTGASEWEQRAERMVRSFHKQYENDWDKAFGLDDALELARIVGHELGDRELHAKQTKPRTVATLGKTPNAVKSRPSAHVGTRLSMADPGTIVDPGPLSRVQSQFGDLESEMVNRPQQSDTSVAEFPVVLPVTSQWFEKPWITFGTGVLAGFVVGACVGRWLLRSR